MKEKSIHYGTPFVDDDEIKQILAVLKSDFLSQGPKIKEFEELMLHYTGARYCVGVSSGTAALHLAVKALNIEKGMKGITSPITFVASANSFLYNHLEPAFADIDFKTFCIDPEQLEKQLTPETKVVIPVHFAGHPAAMPEINSVARSNNTYIIEDAAHAIGSRYENGKPVGCCCFSEMTIFSFHPVKTITTAEGGAITTNDPNLYEKLLMLRNHGLTKAREKLKYLPEDATPQPWYYEMQELGFNFRLTELQAALGVAQLNKLSQFIQRRREIIDTYNNAFNGIPWLTTPFEQEGVFCALHLYVVLVDFVEIKKTRAQVMEELKGKGIGTQVHYIPVHFQPYYRENFGFYKGQYPKAERYYQQCLSIPLHPKMNDKDVSRVIDAITQL